MKRKVVSGVIVGLLVISMLTWVLYLAIAGGSREGEFLEKILPTCHLSSASYDQLATEWNKTFGGSGYDWGHDVVETDDGGYAIVGSTNSYGAGGSDFWLVKTDSVGNREWDRTYGRSDKADYAYSVIQTIDGGYLMAGNLLIKTDSMGNPQWTRYDLGGNSVVQTSDGEYVVAGGSVLFKLDSSGWRERWRQRFEGKYIYSVVQTADGGYALAGGTSFWVESDFCLIKTDSIGRMQWSQTFGGAGNDFAWSLVETNDGGFVLAGATTSFGAGGADFWLVKSFPPIRVHNINTGLGYATIQEAIDAPETVEGHTIKVDADTYYENVVVYKNNLTLAGENPSTTIIDGGPSGNVVTITADYVKISNFTIQSPESLLIRDSRDSGVYLSSVNNCNITGNTITSIYAYGIRLDQSSNNTISRNNITNNYEDGIRLERSSQNNLFWNDIRNHEEAGINSIESSFNAISGNNITNNNYGISLRPSSNNNIIENNIIHSVELWPSSINNIISGNFIRGFVVLVSSNNTISSNTLDGVLHIQSSSYNTISANTITGSIYVSAWSSYNYLLENSITGESGVSLALSPKNVLKNNSIRYSFGVWGTELSHFIQDVDSSNTVDGKPIYYWVNSQNMEVPSDAGYVALVNSSNVIVKSLHLKNNLQGVLLAYTTNSHIINNSVMNNFFGIELYSASNNTISGNNITNNLYGVRTSYSSNNKIFHNNFTNNYQQVGSYDSTNVWDDGYPSGGNYWSDYEDKYPDASEINGSGIWDTPYVIDANNQDRYPLMDPYVPTYLTITVTIGGTTDPTPGTYTYRNGATVPVTAIPDVNYKFEHWMLDGVNAGSDNPIEVLMDSNHTLEAVFTEITYQLSITTTAGGTTDPAPGTYTYVNGTEITVTAIPDAGFSFDYWLLNGEKRTENPITVVMNANHTLEAFFVDNIPPEIGEPVQDPVEDVEPYQNVTVTVNVTDFGTGVYNVTLRYSIDNGTSWMSLNMTEISTNTYQATIPGYDEGAWITYKIVAYDNAGNFAVKDNNGYYYAYHVIPEFTSALILPLLMLATLVATVLLKKKRKLKSQLP
jgi:parallel beta-helix repeat protein